MCDCMSSKLRAATVPAAWLNQSGRVAHPDSPLGAGGGGNFRPPSTLGSTLGGELLPDPQAPESRHVEPDLVTLAANAQAAKAVRQPPPRVAANAAPEVAQGILTLKLLADASGVSGIKGALTSFSEVNNGAQVIIHSDDTGHVDKVTNDLAWTIDIITEYGSGDPDGDAAYGRGTTQSDENAGQVTLGFHESCHRADLLNYFRTEAIPVLDIDFANKKIKTADAEKARSTYTTAWKTYFAKARKFSITNTDEAPGSNPPLSTYKATP